MDYKAIFKGETIPGVSIEQGQAAAVRVFKLDIQQSAHQDKLTKLFSGRPVIIRNKLSSEKAQKLKDGLAKAGLVCHIKQVAPPENQTTASPTPISPTEPDSGAAENEFPGIQPLEEGVVGITGTAAPAPAPIKLAPSIDQGEDFGGLSLEQKNEAPIIKQTPDSSQHDSLDSMSLVAKEENNVVEQHNDPSSTTSDISEFQADDEHTSRERSNSKHNDHELSNNSSGGGPGVDVPGEVSGWCWGGFFLGWIWAVFNRTWIGLLGLIPIANIPVAVLLGIKGRQWAWQNRNWESVEHFNRVQRRWSIAGSILTVFAVWSYYSGLMAVDDMVDENGVIKDGYIETMQDKDQREALKQLQQKFQEELEKQQALQNH